MDLFCEILSRFMEPIGLIFCIFEVFGLRQEITSNAVEIR